MGLRMGLVVLLCGIAMSVPAGAEPMQESDNARDTTIVGWASGWLLLLGVGCEPPRGTVKIISPKDSVLSRTFENAWIFDPEPGGYRIHVKVQARCRIIVHAGATYAQTPDWTVADTLMARRGGEYWWKVLWRNPSPSDSVRMGLEREIRLLRIPNRKH